MNARSKFAHFVDAHRDFAILAVSVGLAACDGGPTQPPRSQPSPAQVDEALAKSPSTVTFAEVARTFALGSKHTDLQRDLLRERLTGNVVLWRLRVYDIQQGDGTYTITFQPVPIADSDAANQVRVVAVVTPRGDADVATLEAAVTDSEITVRGQTQSIILRTVVILSPAVLVNQSF